MDGLVEPRRAMRVPSSQSQGAGCCLSQSGGPSGAARAKWLQVPSSRRACVNTRLLFLEGGKKAGI